MKNVGLDFLTPEEIDGVQTLWRELKDSGRFAAEVGRQIIAPNIARITAALGEEHEVEWVVHAIEVALSEAEPPAPGYLWEGAEDQCQVCRASLGHRLRFMHLGLCDSCANAETH